MMQRKKKGQDAWAERLGAWAGMALLILIIAVFVGYFVAPLFGLHWEALMEPSGFDWVLLAAVSYALVRVMALPGANDDQ